MKDPRSRIVKSHTPEENGIVVLHLDCGHNDFRRLLGEIPGRAICRFCLATGGLGGTDFHITGTHKCAGAML